MRSRVLCVGLCALALALADGRAGAQTKPGSSSSSSSPPPPTDIGGKTLKQWIQDMKSLDASIRENAIRTVPYFGKAGRDAVPTLINLTRDPDASCRLNAMLSLIPFVPYLTPGEVENAIQKLIVSLNQDTQAVVRYNAAIALSAFGPDARPAIPNLITQMRDRSSWVVRQTVVIALSSAAADNKTGPDSRAVNALANLFLNPNTPEESSQVRLEAVIALGAMGRPQLVDQPRAVQALQRALKDTDKSVAIWAHVSLMAVDKVTDEGVGAVAKQLKGKDVTAKVQAARALAAMGRDAKAKVPDLIDLLDDRDLVARAAAVWSLGELGINAAAAVPALTALGAKKDQNEYLKEMAKEALQKINGVKKKP